ncbi:alpha/beta family hydrolase [Priestia aryabhattai]|uniref:alpha/beta family hydrolase n=1 Tax=Priestia aryabhattai TaxID=412384 RepID=UPI000B446619|nr:alpha/beta family hydrolase [Priestia aryabhattai]MBZ6487956.1 alpha/beta hydrolase [Priestia aryabhattai]MDH3114813.1 alpha/beta hydrolase [Priestia aryabhattai]MDH3126292.1 alpha/beta hydrolase [Priestia aryabhattai]MDH3133462.1 alpha/beta hydrolase [Priestia aryabhattai]MED4152959.1 alpha/beta hydrolase [Priestia aryabhattai]
MHVDQKSVSNQTHRITYTHIKTGGPRICFMFSGLGYTYEKPLLYYVTMLMLKHGINVVHIHYTYPKELMTKSTDEIADVMMKDIDLVLQDVLSHDDYQNIIFAGKSIGTIPLIQRMMKDEAYKEAVMLLLTPLLTRTELVESLLESTHKGLIVIGTRDHYYNESVYRLKTKKVHIEVIENADHSLDVLYSPAESLRALETVLDGIEQLL